MGYKLSPDSPNFGDGTQGGPYDKGGSKKGNSPRPQNYTGNYSQPKATGPIVGQAFRKELPPAKKSGDAMTDEAGGDDVSFNSVIKKWR